MKTAAEIIEANAKARAAIVQKEIEACQRLLEHGDSRVVVMWDATAEAFRKIGLLVRRVLGRENWPDGEDGRWWVYPQPAEREQTEKNP